MSEERSPALALAGLGVARGIAIGPAFVTESGTLEVPTYILAATATAGEVARFRTAVEAARAQIVELAGKAASLPGSAAEELGYLLDAHGRMLEDSRLVRGVERRIRERRFNAEAAVAQEVGEIAKAFADMEDSYLAERSKDVRDVGQRLLRSLMAKPYRALKELPAGTVVVADELTPADTALLDPRRVAGFATALGGAQDHTGILARSLGLPAVVGTPELLRHVRAGDTVIVDGGSGQVVVNPDAATRARFEGRRSELRRQARRLERLRHLPARTRDAVEVGLQANIDLAGEVAPALEHGAEGIGLYRTEYLFLNRDDLPGQDEQYAHLRSVVEGMAGRPVTVRTLDIGNDKLPRLPAGHPGGGLRAGEAADGAPKAAGERGEASLFDAARHAVRQAQGTNPAMGLRATRLLLKVEGLLEDQLAAILRAGAHGPVRILLPMISTPAELRQVRRALRETAERLRRRRVAIACPLPPLGAMIEIPGAALAADALAPECEFFSIGTNDLIMYALAIDRGDERVAHLYDPLHPAVLRLVQFATAAAGRAGIPVNVCGEMAGDERMTAILLGFGIRELSMASAAVPRVKQRVRSLDAGEAERRLRTIMEQTDSGTIAALLDDFNALA